MTISKATLTTARDSGVLVNKLASKISCIYYQSMRRYSRVLREFVLYYFPIYNLSMNVFFRFYPVLGFIEALVYQTDDEVENNQSEGYEKLQHYPWYSKQEMNLAVLEEHNLKHCKVESYMQKLGEYFELETQLLASYHVNHGMIKKAAKLRYYDYRLLHCTLIKMLGLNYLEDDLNEELRLTWLLEVLNDIEDDLMFYSDDVAAKHYNTYRMFVKVDGEKAPYFLKKELDFYESLFHKQ